MFDKMESDGFTDDGKMNRRLVAGLIVAMTLAVALTWEYALTHDATGLSFYNDPIGVIVASPLYAGIMTIIAVLVIREMFIEVRD